MIYEFICRKCKLLWDVDGKPSNVPKRRKCPKCQVFCQKNLTAPAFHMKGLIHKSKKHDVLNFYNEAIQDSKEYRDKQKSPYSRWVPDVKALHESGQISRISDKEIARREKGAKDLAQRIKTDTKLHDAEMKKQKSRGNGQFRF